MSEFMDANAPATLEAVVEALTRLSTFGEAEIQELVSAGKIKDVFRFKTPSNRPLPADFVDEGALVEASVLPLSREQRRTLINPA